MSHSQNFKTAIDEKLQKDSLEKEVWDEKKQSVQQNEDTITKNTYPSGQDPYREPVE